MPGAFSPKNLANGVGVTIKTAIYTVPAGRNVIIRSISLVNTSAAEVTVQLTADFGTGSRYVAPKNLVIPPYCQIEHDNSLTMSAGQKLELSVSTAASVDYVVSGVEEV